MNPASHGPAYVLSTVGLALLGLSIASVVVAGALGDEGPRPIVPPWHHRPPRPIHVTHS